MKAIQFYRGGSSLWIRAATIDRDNVVFLSFSREDGGKHDKDKATIMSLGYIDVVRVISTIASGSPDLRIVHKFGEAVTTLSIQAGKNAGTYLWSISKKTGDNTQNVGIYLDGVEMTAARIYLERAIDFLLADHQPPSQRSASTVEF